MRKPWQGWCVAAGSQFQGKRYETLAVGRKCRGHRQLWHSSLVQQGHSLPHMVAAPFIHRFSSSGTLPSQKPMHVYQARGYIKGEVLSFFGSKLGTGVGGSLRLRLSFSAQQVSVGRLQHWTILDIGPFTFERILVVEFGSSPSSLVLCMAVVGWGVEVKLWFQVLLKFKILSSCTCLGCMTYGFVLLSLKNNSVSCQKQNKATLSWFCGYNHT